MDGLVTESWVHSAMFVNWDLMFLSTIFVLRETIEPGKQERTRHVGAVRAQVYCDQIT